MDGWIDDCSLKTQYSWHGSASLEGLKGVRHCPALLGTDSLLGEIGLIPPITQRTGVLSLLKPGLWVHIPERAGLNLLGLGVGGGGLTSLPEEAIKDLCSLDGVFSKTNLLPRL